MPRTILIVCSGVCLFSSTAIFAQSAPKNVPSQKVVSYQLQEQYKWNNSQLPKNSVLLKTKSVYPSTSTLQFSLQKKKEPNFVMPSYTGFVPNKTSGQSFPMLKTQLKKEGQLYYKWQKQSWWKDPLKAPGSNIIRPLAAPGGTQRI